MRLPQKAAFVSHMFYRQPGRDYPIGVRGQEITVIDRDGTRYLDGSGDAAASCFRHDHPDVIAAIQGALEPLDQAPA